jgi:hypothetical protein
VILGIVQAAPNSTIEQTTLIQRKCTMRSSRFQRRATFHITQPFMGFGGMGLKPGVNAPALRGILPEVSQSGGVIPGVRVIATTAPPRFPAAASFPVRSRSPAPPSRASS